MYESDWFTLSYFAVYIGIWLVILVRKYWYIRDCPVPFWLRPKMECFDCSHANRCGRVSSIYRQWGCSEEELRELEKMFEERRTKFEHDDSDFRKGQPEE